jgi:ribosomal protein S18 acetylase RimI-like enzyme
MKITTANYEITAVTAKDLNSIMDVYHQCEDFLALGPQPKATMEMVLSDMEESYSTGGIYCGIRDASGKMVGILDFVPSMYLDNPEHAFILLFMIAAPCRGRGAGAEVVSALERKLADMFEAKTVFSAVQTNNSEGIAFWRKMGYSIVSEPAVQPDTTVTVVIRKDLQ